MTLDGKVKRCKEIIKNCDSAVVAFSGGVDSSVLCKIGHDVLGDKIVAVTAISKTYPAGEASFALEIAKKIGIEHMALSSNELSNPEFTSNSPERCYHCKRELMDKMNDVRKALKFKKILEGTNADDLEDYRPGVKALKEAKAVSPLAEAGLTKSEIRKLAKKYKLPVFDKPATPCLASRIPFGQPVTVEKLERIALAELILHKLGFKVARARDYGNRVRIEVEKGKVERAVELNDKITEYMNKVGYEKIEIDPEGYKVCGANPEYANKTKKRKQPTSRTP